MGRQSTLEVGQEAVRILVEVIQRTCHPIDFGYIAQSGRLHVLVQGMILALDREVCFLVQGTILVLDREMCFLVQGMVQILERYLGEDIQAQDTGFLQADCYSHQA